MLETTRQLLLHLSLIPDIGPAVVEQLVSSFGLEQLESIYNCSTRDFIERGFSGTVAEKLSKGLTDKSLVEKELARIEKYKVQWATRYCADYPELLKNTHLPPIVLYWQGQALTAFDRAIAFVGSRQANSYGFSVIKKIIPELVAANWSIVSGGALGADSMAHEVTLTAGGQTAAIIGSGLLSPYPASNRKLFEKIIEQNGTMISPFPLTMQALPGNFPARNRIISGMSKGVVVIQAAEKSGTRSTALYALEQGREVYAVPGPIDDPLSAGCHSLLQEGARLVTSARDILEELGEQLPVVIKDFGAKKITDSKVIIAKTPKKIIPNETKDPLVLYCANPRGFDELLDYSALSFDDLQNKLCLLQLEGVLEQDFMGRWQAK